VLAQRFGPEFATRGYTFTLLPNPIHPAMLLEKLQESPAGRPRGGATEIALA
jgi:hypothetical protein